jgi:hypothetical protein
VTTTFKWFVVLSAVVFISGFIAHTFSDAASSTAPVVLHAGSSPAPATESTTLATKPVTSTTDTVSTTTATVSPATSAVTPVIDAVTPVIDAAKAERIAEGVTFGLTQEQYENDGVEKEFQQFQRWKDLCYTLKAKPVSELSTNDLESLSHCSVIEKTTLLDILWNTPEGKDKKQEAESRREIKHVTDAVDEERERVKQLPKDKLDKICQIIKNTPARDMNARDFGAMAACASVGK